MRPLSLSTPLDVVHSNGPARMLHQSSTAAAALESNTLGVGFSGSGYLIMYFVGVLSVLRNLGVIDGTTKFAGSSGGSVAGAISCASVSDDTSIAIANALASTCRASGHCRGTLSAIEMAGLSGILPADAHSSCSGRLFVSVTEARANPEADSEKVISSFDTRNSLLQSLLASSYIPGFSGASAVMTPTELGTAAAYDGVCSNPLPLPPGVSYAIAVSALAGPTPPSFSSLIDTVNSNPDASDTTGGPFLPLDPVVQPQPTRLDIWPGLSGPLSMSADAWNSHVTQAPDSSMQQDLYDQGRKDAAAFVSANIPSKAGQVGEALEATAKDVNSVALPVTIEGALSAADAVLSSGKLGDVVGTVATAAANGGIPSVSIPVLGK